MSENKEQKEESELFEQFRFNVDPGQEKVRVDRYLMDKIPGISRNKLQIAIKAGSVRVNDEPVKVNHKVRPNDVITVLLENQREEYELVAENIPLNIVHEDDDIIIINKEAGMVVHPGHGNRSGTLINALMYHFDQLPSRPDGFERPGLVHRLDKLTTGIMVIAKTEHALSHLYQQFFERTNERRYHALVWGDLEEDEGTIEGHIGRHLKNRKNMDVFPDGEYGKHAVTHYKVLERFGYVTLVECKLETGRTHQIRVHFKHIGHPLFGDIDYDGDRILKGTTYTKYKQFIHNCFELLPRQALHAKLLGITHPTSGEFIEFESDLPDDLNAVLEKWRGYIKYRD